MNGSISNEKIDELEICDRVFDTDDVHPSPCAGLLDLKEGSKSGSGKTSNQKSNDLSGKMSRRFPKAPVGKRTQLSGKEKHYPWKKHESRV